MPQLDIATFSTQYFWLVFSFGFFFLSLVRWALPSMTRVLAYRTHATSADEESLSVENASDEQTPEYTQTFEAMQAALQTTQRTLDFPQEIDEAVYGSAVSSFQKSCAVECTLLQAEGLVHSPFAQGSPSLAKSAERAFLRALQERLS